MQKDIQQSEPPAGLAPTACSAAWQPIETAPKDGAPVLLVWHWDSGLHTGTTVVMASWTCRTHAMLSSPHRCPDEPDCKMGWRNYAGNFSHWMPLPEPPNAEVSEPGDRHAENATGAQPPGSLH